MAATPTPDGGPILRIRGLSKTFSGVQVLHGVDLEVMGGEVHALLGQNGSGKSTIIKVLSGYHEPDPGAEIEIVGQPLGSPGTQGIAFVHQDLGLVDAMSILDNLRVGRWRANVRRIHWRTERQRARAALRQFGLPHDPMVEVGAISAADKAIVGLIRALEQLGDRGEGLLVLDEPTASLPRGDVERVFGAVRELATRGFGVLFVSHRLDEVEVLADRASVIRDGRMVGTRTVAETSQDDLVTMILGTQLTELYPETASTGSSVVLEARGLSGIAARDVSFKLHEGEILGMTGLAGMGEDEVPYLLFGAVPLRAGEIHVKGRRVKLSDPLAAMQHGLALVPANRARDSAVPVATVKENVSLTTLGSHYRGGRLRHAEERNSVLKLIREYQVVPPSPDRPLSTLSGGNQQKAVLAKWLQMKPPVVILHEPTQGVDVGSRKQIFSVISEAAAAGAGIIIVSGEYEDLANLCDRVLVFRDGVVASDLAGAHLTRDRIVEQCYRGADAARSG
jgi:ribose transport system ATP-binding protein